MSPKSIFDQAANAVDSIQDSLHLITFKTLYQPLMEIGFHLHYSSQFDVHS